ncbi:MAG: hypothetical protein Q7R93_01650 [bacterium]|nr:hypothetical protein [bacterium]
MHICICSDEDVSRMNVELCGSVSHEVPFNPANITISLRSAQVVGETVLKIKAAAKKAHIMVLQEHIELSGICMMSANLYRSRSETH